MRENQDVWDPADASVDDFAYEIEEKEYKFGREQHLNLTPLFHPYIPDSLVLSSRHSRTFRMS